MKRKKILGWGEALWDPHDLECWAIRVAPRPEWELSALAMSDNVVKGGGK